MDEAARLGLFALIAVTMVTGVAGVVFPRLLAWLARVVTVVAGLMMIGALAFGALQYANVAASLRVMRAVTSGDPAGLTAEERRRYFDRRIEDKR